jgi:hypothetical protein
MAMYRYDGFSLYVKDFNAKENSDGEFCNPTHKKYRINGKIGKRYLMP